MSSSTNPRLRTRWGRSRFGGGGGLLVGTSIALGLLLSAGIGWASTVVEPDPARTWALFLVAAAATLPISVMLVWVLLVDRSTISGATDDPESSIESHWYDRAAVGAFTDLLVALGVGTAVFSFVRIDLAPSIILIALFLIAGASFGLRYWWLSRREG
ncbi:MAG: hypothetical protein QM714_06175 [Nocardioides sp.]|uniref:hypothetical protein n=1 Tax=Nocardioides sp. TaxID=35761 RepID=UPI0039E5D71D